MKRKPFDLEAAKRGEPVVTRNGKPWHFGCYMVQAQEGARLVGMVDGWTVVSMWDDSGQFAASRNGLGCQSDFDLFMAPRRVQTWARLYRGETGVLLVASARAPEGDAPRWTISRDWLGDPVKVGEPQVEDDE